jgi:hypothetical protein
MKDKIRFAAAYLLLWITGITPKYKPRDQGEKC